MTETVRGVSYHDDFLVRDGISLNGTNVVAATASAGLGDEERASRPADVSSMSLIRAALPSIGIKEIMHTCSTDASSASKTAFGFPSDQPAREPLRDLKLRSPKDYADSTTSRALFVKEWNAMLGLCGASRPANTIPRLIFVRADAGSERKPQPPSFLCTSWAAK